MKSNIQRKKEEIRAFYKENKRLWICENGYDYIGIVLKEKDEEGNNIFFAIMADSSEEDIKEFLNTPVRSIERIEEWYAGCNKGGVEYVTDSKNYCIETINTLQ